MPDQYPHKKLKVKLIDTPILGTYRPLERKNQAIQTWFSSTSICGVFENGLVVGVFLPK
jgi:hypothetical protein